MVEERVSERRIWAENTLMKTWTRGDGGRLLQYPRISRLIQVLFSDSVSLLDRHSYQTVELRYSSIECYSTRV